MLGGAAVEVTAMVQKARMTVTENFIAAAWENIDGED